MRDIPAIILAGPVYSVPGGRWDITRVEISRVAPTKTGTQIEATLLLRGRKRRSFFCLQRVFFKEYFGCLKINNSSRDEICL